ncbi:hypothetical protein OG440_22890 [Streptomyces sp. NBC_00637]|uniref:hypothetical protein n=1 Tax=Streptomyces sp. NBC_00637 TaxID=2903667 RepID=UPI00324860FB
MNDRHPTPDTPADTPPDPDSVRVSDSDPVSGGGPDPQRYEPPPSVGKLLGWILLFVVAAVVVVLGGVYLT